MIMIPSFPNRGHALKRTLAAAGLIGAMAAPALAQNYEGPQQVRVGAFLQGGTTTLDGTFTPGTLSTLPAASGSGNLSNNGAGITAGFEVLRQGGWTYGVEGDFGITGGSKAIASARYATDYFGSARGRLGVYVRPDWVVYGTGGIGFRGVTISEQPGGASNGKTLTGGVFGLGSEWQRGNTIFFAEYLHSQFSNATVAVTSQFSSGTSIITNNSTYTVKGNSDAVRVGVKFKVGFDGYYDEVRDGLRK